jgi:flagellar motor switch protein FliG
MSAPATPAAKLTAPQRAALVLLALDEDVARDILRQMDPKDLRKLAKAADSLSGVSPEAIEPAFAEFEKALSARLLPSSGGDYLRQLTAKSLGADKASELFTGTPAPAPVAPMDAIKSARTQALAELLAEEHPQVATVILSQLPRQQAAEVLLAMPAEVQGELIGRVAALEEVPAEMVTLASEALAKALASSGGLNQSDERRDFDGVAFAADLLNELAPADSERLIGNVEQSHGKLAPRIREAMFTFENLAELDPRQMQPLMREVPSETLLVALKTATSELRERFLAAVSSRAAETMREDLAAMPPTRLSDVEKAQREVVETALKMAAEGRLVLPGGAAEKMV